MSSNSNPPLHHQVRATIASPSVGVIAPRGSVILVVPSIVLQNALGKDPTSQLRQNVQAYMKWLEERTPYDYLSSVHGIDISQD